MTESETQAQERYRYDAEVLARIGRCLAGQIAPMTVRLPVELAEQAALAWARDEQHDPRPATPEQMLLRHFSATLAFVGLAVGDDLDQQGEEIVVTLRPEDVASCMFAAEHASHVKHAEVAGATSGPTDGPDPDLRLGPDEG